MEAKFSRIKDYLVQGIQVRKFKHKLPSENELAREFSVSRMTARKVLGDLEFEGWVERIKGKGTYVRKQDYSTGYFIVQPSKKQAYDLGVDYTCQVLQLDLLSEPPSEIVRLLDYKEQTIFTRRLHLFDAQPVRYELRYLRGDLCQGFLEEDLEQVSIHELLVDKYELPLSKVWQRITATLMNREIAAVFDQSPGYPAFHIKRTTFTAQTPVTYVEYFIRGEVAFEDTFAPNSVRF